MSRPERVVYEEVTRMPWWAVVLVWVPCLIAAYHLAQPVLKAEAAGAGTQGLVRLVVLLLLPLLLHVLFGKLRIRVTRTSLHLDFGYTGLISRVIDYREILGMEPVRYSPIREFGGWGIRSSFKGRKRAWTMSGNRALVLSLVDGKRFYVGSPDPGRLADRIRLVAEIPTQAKDEG